MKLYKNISLLLIPFVVLGLMTISSCEDETGIYVETPNGPPSIQYIRVTNPESSDSLLVSAELGGVIAIIGENLGGTREIWFNDQQAELQPNQVTNTSLIVAVPNLAPTAVTDELHLVGANSDTLSHPFVVAIAAPEIYSAVNEWPQAGENLVLDGNFFFEPITITFEGGETGEVVSISQTSLEVTVPAGATEGPVVVSTNFGEGVSSFNVWDSRNIVLDFDGLNGNGWRTGLTGTGDGEINGNYLIVEGNIGANQIAEGDGASPFLMEYWGGADASRTENFYPLFPGSYQQYVLKFEAKVNTWYGGYLNLCLAAPDHFDSNQEIWSNDLNARAIWGPWDEAGEEFTTDGRWITVVVPMTEFQYYREGDDPIEYTGDQEFIEANVGSFSTWLLGSPENSDNFVQFYIDNIRFVPAN